MDLNWNLIVAKVASLILALTLCSCGVKISDLEDEEEDESKSNTVTGIVAVEATDGSWETVELEDVRCTVSPTGDRIVIHYEEEWFWWQHRNVTDDLDFNLSIRLLDRNTPMSLNEGTRTQWSVWMTQPGDRPIWFNSLNDQHSADQAMLSLQGNVDDGILGTVQIFAFRSGSASGSGRETDIDMNFSCYEFDLE